MLCDGMPLAATIEDAADWRALLCSTLLYSALL